MKRNAITFSLLGLSALVLSSQDFAAAQSTTITSSTSASTITSSSPTSMTGQPQPKPGAIYEQGILFPHFLLDRALAGRVDKEGYVNYVALKGDKNLAAYTNAVATADLSRFPVLPGAPRADDKLQKPTENRNPEMVLWINAYNAFVVQTLAEAYPLNSPDDIKDFDTAKKYVVAGQKVSLRDMRRKIASFDPRALFTLTNGTVGGPLLQEIAYRFYGIDQQLENAVQAYVNDPRNVVLSRINNKVMLNSYLTEFNDAFAPKTDPKKMLGVRFLLGSYVGRRGGGSYYRTNEYQIETQKSNRTLNYRAGETSVGIN